MDEQEEGIESFDDSYEAGEEQGAEAEPEKKDDEKETQTQQLEEQNEDTDSKDEKDDKEKDDKEKKEEGEDEKKEEGETKAPVKKLLRAIVDGKETGIDPEMTFNTKVDGKNRTVTMRELLDTHSGHSSLDKRFTDYKTKERDMVKRDTVHAQEKENINNHFSKIGKILDDDRVDPMDALYYLLDITGRSPVEYHKRAISYRQEEFRALDEMSEAETELYWTKKEMAAHKRHQQSETERYQQMKTQEEHTASVTKTREAQGVNEVQFDEAESELKELGYKSDEITPERVAQYAKYMPFLSKAEELTKPYQADLEDKDVDALTSAIANTLMSFPHFTEEQALIESAKQIGLEVESDDADIEALNQKNQQGSELTDQKKKFSTKIEKEEDIEEFDDDDYY